MTYDGLDRLQAVASNMYGAAGATYTYNVLDDLTRVKIGGTAARDHYYCYDNGQLTSIRTAACSGGGSTVHGLGYDVQGNLENKNGQHYRFDYGHRLREVDGVERYRYDAHGRRVLAMQFETARAVNVCQDWRMMYQKSDRQRRATTCTGRKPGGDPRDPIGGGAKPKYSHRRAGSLMVTNDAGTALETTEYEPYGGAEPAVHEGPGIQAREDAATDWCRCSSAITIQGSGVLSVDPVTHTAARVQFNRYRLQTAIPRSTTRWKSARATGSMISGGQLAWAGLATTAKECRRRRAESKVCPGAAAAAQRRNRGM